MRCAKASALVLYIIISAASRARAKHSLLRTGNAQPSEDPGPQELAFSVRRPPGAVSLVVTHTDRVSFVYFTCMTTATCQRRHQTLQAQLEN